jgi:predicted transposase/invertase (TIGR01784 family)
LRHTYQIAFIVKDTLFNDKPFTHNFEYYDPVNNLSLGGRSHIMTVELPKVEAIAATKPVAAMTAPERWAVYFRYNADEERSALLEEIRSYEEGIAMANEVLFTITQDDKEWARLLSEYKYEVDRQSKMVTYKREGIAIGEARGIAIGEAQGIVIGEARQKEENRQDKLQTALKMKKRGYPLNDIAEDLGLTFEEVERI